MTLNLIKRKKKMSAGSLRRAILEVRNGIKCDFGFWKCNQMRYYFNLFIYLNVPFPATFSLFSSFQYS